MNVGQEIFDLARASGARSVFVAGIGKNVGKTVTMRAIYEAAYARGLRVGVASIGRDGEAIDAGDAAPKPRIFLRPGTLFATAREVLPHSPAVELVELSRLQTAAGALLYARVAQGAHYELVGPPTASGVREVVDELNSRCEATVVDGAIDRVAALAGTAGAIVVAVGASAAGTIDEAVDAAGGLVRRLTVARYDGREDALHVEGALTATNAARLIAAGELRTIVVRDPTQIALAGKAASNAFARLRIRCIRPLSVVAVTVASIGRDRVFEPQAFLRAVAEAVALPAFDVYAGVRAA
jgi:hypothetical protein